MEYNPPAGALPGAPYVDGDRSAGIKGSIVPAAAIEFPQREIAHIVSFAGLTPNNADLEQLRKAVEALIEAATGGGDVNQYILMSQARARLPIFPEILSADGRINVSSPAAGTIQVPGSVSFMHRGIAPVSTSDYSEPQRTFTTEAGKTYHLRWTPGGGFALRDLANPAYNPSFAPETVVSFDSAYDDMLIARVVTSSANVATITNLANSNVLVAGGEVLGANGGLGTFEYEDQTRPSQITKYAPQTVNFARTPQSFLTALNDVLTQYKPPQWNEFSVGVRTLNRYQIAVWAQGDADVWTGWAARA